MGMDEATAVGRGWVSADGGAWSEIRVYNDGINHIQIHVGLFVSTSLVDQPVIGQGLSCIEYCLVFRITFS